MVQVLEKVENEAIYILIPEVQEKAEKVEEKKDHIKKRIKIRKHAKQHQERLSINQVRNNIDACWYGANNYNR